MHFKIVGLNGKDMIYDFIFSKFRNFKFYVFIDIN